MTARLLRVGELFSGIGGFAAAFHEAGGARVMWASEINPAAQAVYRRHFPRVRQVGDITKFHPNRRRDAIDVLVGGWPCQDLSVAGKRKGLSGARSGLFHELTRVAGVLRPRWLLLENVPGLLTAGKDDAGRPLPGRDFAIVLAALGSLGYHVGWRCLDAQFFGVAQRRERVFLVGRLGNGRGVGPGGARRCERLRGLPLEVLLEPDSVPRYPGARAAPGPNPAAAPLAGALCASRGRHDNGDPGMALAVTRPDDTLALELDYGGTLTPWDGQAVRVYGQGGPAPTLSARESKSPSSQAVLAHCLTASAEKGGHSDSPNVIAVRTAHGSGRGLGIQAEVAHTCETGGPEALLDRRQLVIPISTDAGRGRDGASITPSLDDRGVSRIRDAGLGVGDPGDPAFTVQAGGPPAVMAPLAIDLHGVTSDENRSVPQPLAPTLGATSAADAALIEGLRVRRFTPRECERLQGYQDDWTGSTHEGRPIADGPRYRMTGNAVAVPVVVWLARRLVRLDRATR